MRRLVVGYLTVFLAGFVLNQALTAVCFSAGAGYLTAQVRWFAQSFKDCLINIYWHIRAVLLGQGIYYSKFYPAGCLLLMGTVLYGGRDNKRKSVFAGSVIGLLTAIAAPFYMTILCAVEPVRRSQLVMPFALAFVAYALILCGGKKRHAIVLILCVITGYVQLSDTMRLNYTDSVRYESDVRTAYAIMEDLDKLEEDAHAYPIIFIGKRAAELNNSCVIGDTIGYSFFEWDADVWPQGFYSTRRIIHFFHALGGDYHRGNEEQALKAAEHGKCMNNWPMEGSIALHDGCIIVKLSD